MNPDLGKLPGFPALKKVRVSGEVAFHKTDATAAEALRAAMLSPASDRATKTVAVKRTKKSARKAV